MSGRLANVTLVGRASEKVVELAAYLDAEGRETAARDSNAWIKALRHVRVDGSALRDLFVYRGDSLWWFTELYLHKMGAVTSARVGARGGGCDTGPATSTAILQCAAGTRSTSGFHPCASPAASRHHA